MTTNDTAQSHRDAIDQANATARLLADQRAQS